MDPKTYNVLFICTGNSARSIMVECALNRWGAGKFHACSAGSHTRGELHPMALTLLNRLNYLTAGLRSKDWQGFAQPSSPPLDFTFTVCDKAAGEVCPVWPSQPMTAHWDTEDPASFIGPEEATYQIFKKVFLDLENRIKIFVNLPFRSLDKLSLQKKLNEIGKH